MNICNKNHLYPDEHTDSCFDTPVEVPSDGNFDLDSFLDSLPSSLRMKVVQEKFGGPEPTVHRGIEAPRQTAVGGPWTREKVLVAALVAPVLLCLAVLVLAGQVADVLMKSVIKYAKEKLSG